MPDQKGATEECAIKTNYEGEDLLPWLLEQLEVEPVDRPTLDVHCTFANSGTGHVISKVQVDPDTTIHREGEFLQVFLRHDDGTWSVAYYLYPKQAPLHSDDLIISRVAIWMD